jgi:hypothetical protein
MVAIVPFPDSYTAAKIEDANLWKNDIAMKDLRRSA